MLELTVYPTSTIPSVSTSVDVQGRNVGRGDLTSPLPALILWTWVGPWRLGLLLGVRMILFSCTVRSVGWGENRKIMERNSPETVRERHFGGHF